MWAAQATLAAKGWPTRETGLNSPSRGPLNRCPVREPFPARTLDRAGRYRPDTIFSPTPFSKTHQTPAAPACLDSLASVRLSWLGMQIAIIFDNLGRIMGVRRQGVFDAPAEPHLSLSDMLRRLIRTRHTLLYHLRTYISAYLQSNLSLLAFF